MPNFKDLSGMVFGRLTAVCVSTGPKKNRTYWECICVCGKEKSVETSNLSAGKIRSCGCLSSEVTAKRNTTHNFSNKEWRRTYVSWVNMIRRCTDIENLHYCDYGGRGISVCDRWTKVENFASDMGKRPPGMTLDRIDNNGNYEPGNCRWATRKEQSNNTRSNVRLLFQGESLTLSEWEDRVGINQHTIHTRLERGWSIERILTTPVINKEAH